MPLAVLLVLACVSGKKKESKIAAATSALDEEILVDEGDSSEPFYAPSGDRLLFVSRARATHAQPQIYEKNLATGQERRLTFQNGATFSPRYHPKEPWIVYASTTDELKENPPLLNPPGDPAKVPGDYQHPTEIYIHSLDGLEITRVTDRHGFDGLPQFSTDGRLLTWTRVEKNRTAVTSLNRQTKSLMNLRHLGVNPAGYVLGADKKTAAWLDWDAEYATVRLMVRLGSAPPIEVNSEHLVRKSDLALSPDNRLLAWSQFNAINQRYEIWTYNADTKCAYMLIGSDSADRRHPAFSPDGKLLS